MENDIFKDISACRRRAFGYIKYLLSVINSCKDNDNDAKLAKLLGVQMEALTDLRDGRNNPSAEVVKAVKHYFKEYPDCLIEAEIQQFLIDPFVKRDKYST